MSILNDTDAGFDDGMMSLEDLEPDEKGETDQADWGDEYDDMDSESWDRQYGDEEEELEGDPWDLN